MILKSTFHTFILIGIALLVLNACNDSRETETIDVYQGYEYFPLEVGKFIEYQVDSITFDTTAIGIVIDSSLTYVREEITEEFENITGGNDFRVERFERKDQNDPWAIKSVFTATRNETQAIRTENNFRFVKMIFPLEDGEIWDGNQFIDPTTVITIEGETLEIYKDWLYEVDDVHEIDLYNGMPFDSVTTIFQAQNENLIEYRYSVEKYATGIGLIYREMWILDTQCIEDCLGQTWEDKAQKGFILKQTITAHN